MVLKCPNCGQQLRGEPSASGTCPKCKTKLKFPEGDPNHGEPITCPHCGQAQRYTNGRCISCGKRFDETDQPQNVKPKKSRIRLIASILVVAIAAYFIYFKVIAPRDVDNDYSSLDSDFEYDYDYSSEEEWDSDFGGTSNYSYSSDDVSDDYKLALFMLAQDEVRAQLKSPSTAVFASSYTGSDVVYSRDGTTYGMISWVESENSYGATVRENFTLFCTISGGKISDITCIIGIPE